MENTKQQEMQQKYMQLQMMEQQIKQVDAQLNGIDNQLNELQTTKDAIVSMMNSNEGDEILIPLGAGVFMKTISKDNQKFILNTGADCAVEKEGKDIEKMIKEQSEEMKKIRLQLESQKNKMRETTKNIQQELSK